MVNNPNVHHYLEKKQLCLLKKSRQYIENIQIHTFKIVGRFALILKETDEFIG
jgi:hypothetical protein